MTYDELLETLHRSVSGDWLYHKQNGVFTFRHNLDVRVEKATFPKKDDSYKESWACRLSDSKARKVVYDLYFRNSVVERFTLISVDGGAAEIPVPKHGLGLVISSKDYAVAQVVNRKGQLDEYLDRCGIRRHED